MVKLQIQAGELVAKRRSHNLKMGTSKYVMYIKGQNFRNSTRTINSLLDRIHPIVCIIFLTATAIAYTKVHRKTHQKFYIFMQQGHLLHF